MKKLAAPLIFIAAVLAIIAIVLGIKWSQLPSEGESFMPPPTAVSVFETQTQTWPSSISAIGTVKADEGIIITAEVPGTVTKIYFNSGDMVKADELLLEQESGNEKAALEAAQAQLRLANYNFGQVSKLRKKNTVSENQYETAKQQLDSAKANVGNIKSSLKKKQIRARFAGRLGIRKVDLGEDLRSGSEIVALHSHEKLKVTFPIPQRWLSRIHAGQQVQAQMIESEGETVSGEITAIDSSVNEVTRNIEVEATLANATGKLYPGMAVDISVSLPETAELLVIPSTAVIYAPFGDTVFVVEKNEDTGQLVARQQFIQIGAQRGDFVAIIKGLNKGDKVASAGAFKLFNGQPVSITEQPEVNYSLNPTPSDS